MFNFSITAVNLSKGFNSGPPDRIIQKAVPFEYTNSFVSLGHPDTVGKHGNYINCRILPAPVELFNSLLKQNQLSTCQRIVETWFPFVKRRLSFLQRNYRYIPIITSMKHGSIHPSH